MSIPPNFYLLHYDESTGEVLSFWNPMRGETTDSPTIIISVEQHAEVSADTNSYRVQDNKLVRLVEEKEEVRRPIDVPSAIVGGLVYEGVCYALEPTALSVMLLDLNSGSKEVRAIIHTSEGTEVKTLAKAEAHKVSAAISEHFIGLHLG